MRYKEEWCFNSFSDHGTVVFDNDLRAQMPEVGTTGRAQDGSYNDTMTIEDFLDGEYEPPLGLNVDFFLPEEYETECSAFSGYCVFEVNQNLDPYIMFFHHYNFLK